MEMSDIRPVDSYDIKKPHIYKAPKKTKRKKKKRIYIHILGPDNWTKVAAF